MVFDEIKLNLFELSTIMSVIAACDSIIMEISQANKPINSLRMENKRVFTQFVLVILFLATSNKLVGQVSSYDSFLYSKMTNTIKSVIIQSC